MNLLRQGPRFALVGLVQWAIDWGLLVALSHLGIAIATANIVGRIAGALAGFWLNGNLTFGGGGTSRWRQFARYAVLWGINTVFSTMAMAWIDAHAGLHGAWLAKPLVEGVLAVNTFLLSRWWVYR